MIFSRSVSASSASSEELRQQIRKHKATRPAIDLEAEKASKENSQEPTDGNFISDFSKDCFEFLQIYFYVLSFLLFIFLFKNEPDAGSVPGVSEDLIK